jgi:hypothetical protein
MKRSATRSGVALSLAALLGLGCAQLPLLAAFKEEPVQLEARGPGAVFQSIDAAAVDALTYAYLQAQAAHETQLMRGGPIHRTAKGYSYSEIHVAGPEVPDVVRYTLKPEDVAHFTVYAPSGNRDVDLRNERPSRADRHFVSFVDPLHRPLYILHPSLVIREYHGDGHDLADVADLRQPAQTPLFAKTPCGACSALP